MNTVNRTIFIYPISPLQAETVNYSVAPCVSTAIFGWPHLTPLLRKLRQFEALQDGWSHGDGVRISPSAIETAKGLLVKSVVFQLKADVFPDPDGGCAVAFYRGQDAVEVKVQSDGQTFQLSAERGIGFQFENIIDPKENATQLEIDEQLGKLTIGDKWKSYEFLASDNLTQHVRDFVIPSTRIHQDRMELLTGSGGSQYSIPFVPALV